ncbi:unnamed protein product [Effrenium voratum]|nr:unnamed protein product [Effrenium voratum]|mmetsp:Transcript_94602/g.225435  ORF Transcript_94602/g.225435 Transcript_94602/m.225435 type:complete len:195 (-) Transcript_94602:137-721(-)
MADALNTKFSFLSSHGGPGSRKMHGFEGTLYGAPHRSASMPHMNLPAGHSAKLGNHLGFNAYANLRGPFVARRDVPLLPKNPRAVEREIYRAKVADTWVMPERIRPETLPPAGGMKERKQGKRLVSENTNTLSHVDTLIWDTDIDKSDGVLRQVDSAIYKGAAGLNAKAERTPIYGHLPPHCCRTFGADPYQIQ